MLIYSFVTARLKKHLMQLRLESEKLNAQKYKQIF